ncbi:LysE/ArgO family amino acid transporter [uncultured Planktomarina sp.]|uniref:LysE/ArgO family amino acid transporter n=1 Tax=uncultured Planktomarina sp. TaxID=1538529 RepID=UPI003260575E
MTQAFFTGFITLMSLILAVGAQNVFILRQGILRRHVLTLCLFAAASDALLIWTGVIGFGVLAQMAPGIARLMTWCGAVFLCTYGALRFRAAYRGDYRLELGEGRESLKKTLLTLAGFTFLNPHVYLDTIGLIGAVSAQYDADSLRYAFATGASLGSLVFFCALGFGARLLAPLMGSSKAWRVLDILVGMTMWAIAALLVCS